jgi:hypothetical protein
MLESDHQIKGFARVLSIPKFVNVEPQRDTNFGIGTLDALTGFKALETMK